MFWFIVGMRGGEGNEEEKEDKKRGSEMMREASGTCFFFVCWLLLERCLFLCDLGVKRLEQARGYTQLDKRNSF
jgi:hypothetical protein